LHKHEENKKGRVKRGVIKRWREGGRESVAERQRTIQSKRLRDRETREIKRQKVVQLCRDTERLKSWDTEMLTWRDRRMERQTYCVTVMEKERQRDS
jgi:hypothetical protein